MTLAQDASFHALLDYLRASRGFDFSTYKPATLTRRISKRIAEVGLDSYADYIDYLEVHGDEFTRLFNAILINVTGFFRDEKAWTHLRERFVPKVLENNVSDTIRVWSAGCASGEEAYSLAMVLAEALGEADFRRRVKIYATDVDEEALSQARQGAYPERAMQPVPADWRERYFEAVGTDHVFRGDLRRSIVFGWLDLTRDAPISRLDLLVCRNTLMYFNTETQAAIIRRLHFALKPLGFLFLGRAEMLLSHGSLFHPLDAHVRIFARMPGGIPGERRIEPVIEPTGQLGGTEARATHLRDVAFETAHLPQIVLDAEGLMVAVNHTARLMFRLNGRDLGRLFQDLEVSYRPVELRAPIEDARRQRLTVRIDNVELPRPDGQPRLLEVRVTPLIDGDLVVGVVISFLDITPERTLEAQLLRANEELDTAYVELQSTNEELQTTSEELQSTVEELETTNEELQSTNEELETTNEELRSTNEELETMNDELRIRTDEVDRGNAFLSAIVNGVGVGVIVLDIHRLVRIWNRVAEDLWGLRTDEVTGRPFFGLDVGLPVDQLLSVVEHCLTDNRPGELVVEAVNRRGRPVRCRITCAPMTAATGGGALLVMEDEGGMAAPTLSGAGQ